MGFSSFWEKIVPLKNIRLTIIVFSDECLKNDSVYFLDK